HRAHRGPRRRGRCHASDGRAVGAGPRIGGEYMAKSNARHVAPLLAGGVLGAAAEYLFDPSSGRRRRHLVRDRSLATARHRARETIRRARYLEGIAEGTAHRVTRAAHPRSNHDEPPDDITLSRKVESIAFRRAHTPRG